MRKRQEAADKAKTAAVGVRIFHISKVCPHPRNRAPPLPSPRPRPSPLLHSSPGARGHLLQGLPTAAPALLDGEAVGGLAQEHGRVRGGHISFVCGDPLFEDDLEDQELVKLKETFFVKKARSCSDSVERDFFNTGGVKGRTEFEYICSCLLYTSPSPRDRG